MVLEAFKVVEAFECVEAFEGVEAFKDVGIRFQRKEQEFLEFPVAFLRFVCLDLLGDAKERPV